MSEKDVFKQQRPISPGEFGEDDGDAVDAVRSQFQTPVPQQFQQKMDADHPLNQDRRVLRQTPPQEEAFSPTLKKVTPHDRFAEFKDQKFEKLLEQLVEKTGGFHEVNLPSMGKFYLKGEGPGDGVLHIRPMTGREEQFLYQPKLIKKNQAVNMIFKEVIGEQVNPELLLSEDRQFLLIYLRGISHSPFYDVEIKCPECTKPFQTQINLNDLAVDYCPAHFGPDALEGTLPTSGFKIHYRLATGRDETLVTEYRDRRIKDFGDQASDDSMSYRESQLVEDIEGVTNKMMIQQLLDRLPVNDRAHLRELLNEPPFGVDDKVGMVCPNCSHEFEIGMPMELGFFFPKPNSQKKKPQPA